MGNRWTLGCAALVVMACVVTGQAAQRPVLSPRVTSEGTIDGVRISIEYGAPSKRGRVIWGGLRPWGEWWMPGADAATTMTTSGALMVGTIAVPRGDHTIYTLPGEDEFLLMINARTGQFHTQYSPELDLGRTPMTLTTLTEPVERMTFAIDANPDGDGGFLKLIWDDRAYAVPVHALKLP